MEIAMNIAQPMLSVADYAEHVGKTERTVRMWLNNGELPAAMQDDRGRWSIPADAVRQPRPIELVKADRAAAGAPAPVDASTLPAMLDRMPVFVPLADAARVLGLTEYAIRTNRAAFDVQSWGDHGALVVPQRAIRTWAGL